MYYEHTYTHKHANTDKYPSSPNCYPNGYPDTYSNRYSIDDYTNAY
jgi:hypothetical protein